ncbi:MAG: hypothetical protein R3261_04750, partial [Alphaproteobacteria bacterium]|nr:hypothetical protein [Alphaproteobacteria bacterium]
MSINKHPLSSKGRVTLSSRKNGYICTIVKPALKFSLIALAFGFGLSILVQGPALAQSVNIDIG